MSQSTDFHKFLDRKSFIELGARERAKAVLDAGSFRELLGPFDRLHSPWLEMQGIVPQEDDGVIIAKGTIDKKPTVVIAIESAFQGGSMGEIGGTKIATALELATLDNEKGTRTSAVILFETGGVRLQEANLGLATIAEIHSGIVGLRRHAPVIGVISGLVGCFGGMSLAAALCSRLIVTRQARLGMNGPEVIEQEAGIEELDASDKQMIWSLIGGEQRYQTDLADIMVEDDVKEMSLAIRSAIEAGVPKEHRTERVQFYLDRLGKIDTSKQMTGSELRETWKRSQKP